MLVGSESRSDFQQVVNTQKRGVVTAVKNTFNGSYNTCFRHKRYLSYKHNLMDSTTPNTRRTGSGRNRVGGKH